jgi:hypothetical protein
MGVDDYARARSDRGKGVNCPCRLIPATSEADAPPRSGRPASEQDLARGGPAGMPCGVSTTANCGIARERLHAHASTSVAGASTGYWLRGL